MPLLFTPEELKQMASTFDYISYKPLTKAALNKIVSEYETSINLHP